MQHINWDNLRFVLMVANKGSIAAAARELRVNRSTVLRRIDAFQKSLDCKIFERSEKGYTLTVEAEKMIGAAREVESTLYNMQREIAGRELRLDGNLSVATTGSLMLTIMGPILAGFHRIHPQILIDVIVTGDVLDLNRRDADVAIRPTDAPQAPLLGYRLCNLEFGVYASPNYLSRNSVGHWRDHRWIGLDSNFHSTPPGRWFEVNVPDRQVCVRADSFVTAIVAAENDLGATLLPCLAGDDSAKLQRIDAPVKALTVGLWALTHPDLMRAARVHAFIEYLRAHFAS